MVFKLFLSTLIGNLLLKEFFIFFRLAPLLILLWVLYMCTCLLCGGFTSSSALWNRASNNERTKKQQQISFFRQSFHPRAHIHLSPHWHRAIKHLWRTFFFRALLWVSNMEAFPLASSQLCGVIDFNIIDFLCHYQPLAPLFLVLCTQKCFCIGMEKRLRREEEKQQRKKHKTQHKKRSFYYKRVFYTYRTDGAAKHNIVMLIYYIKQHKNILFGRKSFW